MTHVHGYQVKMKAERESKEGGFLQVRYATSLVGLALEQEWLQHGLEKEMVLDKEGTYASIFVIITYLYAPQRQKHRSEKEKSSKVKKLFSYFNPVTEIKVLILASKEGSWRRRRRRSSEQRDIYRAKFCYSAKIYSSGEKKNIQCRESGHNGLDYEQAGG